MNSNQFSILAAAAGFGWILVAVLAACCLAMMFGMRSMGSNSKKKDKDHPDDASGQKH